VHTVSTSEGRDRVSRPSRISGILGLFGWSFDPRVAASRRGIPNGGGTRG
jgi:hypothetical protein